MKRWVVICCCALLAVVCADECPDGGSCDDGQTCCKHPTDGYECCPFDQAECCADHVHCCPAGTTCDTSKSSCVNATVSIPWAERSPVQQPRVSKSFRMIKSYIGEDDDNICPDQSRCPAEFSCLRALTKYGCCPLAQGIPCSDGKHCCPEGHSCSEDSRSCIKKDLVTTVLCSDGESECPEESSCCQSADGQFGCCPMPHAVCCEDKTHCCPEGSSCDVQLSKCISLSSQKELPMWAKFPARKRADWENQKESHHVTAEAVSEDDVPEPSVRASNVTCDPTQSCPDDTTCCSDGQGGWGCCPYPNAVCCSDHQHCCPSGTTCDLGQGTCDSGSEFTTMSQKTPAVRTTAPATATESQVIEPAQTEESEEDDEQDYEEDDDDDDDEDDQDKLHCNHHNHCPRNSTCCRFGHRRWRCCPMPHAVCCSDSKHCCPQHFNCSKSHQGCVRDDVVIPWYKKLPAKSSPEPQVSNDVPEPSVRAANVTCDPTQSCPDDTTCCSDGQGGWGCCPYPNAVCCSDHQHCCPSGTTCDLGQGTCNSGSEITIISQKTPAARTTAPATATESQVIEPAQTEESEEDDEQDYEEDDEQDYDDDDDDEDDQDKLHCNHHNHCPRNSTCCRFGHRRWRCCPMPHAVCCSDSKHCCPQHFNCSKSHQGCVRDDVVIPWYKKLPAKSSPEPQVSNDLAEPGERASNVTCDPTHTCPDDTTCCSDGEGGWACCPFPNAVCCTDHVHCCPSGWTCDLAQQACVQASDSIPISQMITEPAQTESPEEDEEDEEDDEEEAEDCVHCDGHTSCPRDTTCCRMGDKWGCCPLQRAVCCSDRKHCCPEHYKCSKSHQACVRDNVVIPWYTKLPALSSLEADSETDYVRCRDKKLCPPYNTCCLLSSGEYGCCPMENAVCCSDNKHCCPQGYTCDISSQLCERAVLLEVELVPLTPVSLPKTEPVRETFEQCDCPDTFKCCEVTPSQWFCCPYTYGVCCSGSDHCCPQGKHCAPGGGCSSNSWLPWDNWPFFRREQKKPQIL